jgi:hypothetical protein
VVGRIELERPLLYEEVVVSWIFAGWTMPVFVFYDVSFV